MALNLSPAQERVLVMLWSDPDEWLDREMPICGSDCAPARALERKKLVVMRRSSWSRAHYRAGGGWKGPKSGTTLRLKYVTPEGCRHAERLTEKGQPHA